MIKTPGFKIGLSVWSDASWKMMLERRPGNVVISVVCAVMYVVVSKAEKHLPYGDVKGKGKSHPITGHQWPRGGVEV
jgi:hypothetical protein